ncbi:thioredoxin-like protein [Epithele typhae]|uniref:thioredoxin-like protein n=1 Tax=Epithele typhae TaxID=378194 RepID=UPI0020089A67|nr:thioredoxin-like protein [Epithele typhae]KAH9945368.1 thioredoxin-like protein [Epithele typhae]
MMHPGVVTLVVISDMVCPWCYIGHRELKKALEDTKHDCADMTIKIEHRPFLLHPSMGEDEFVEKLPWYLEKFGEERVAQIQDMVGTRAKEVGIEITFAGIMAQTIRAHRLSRKAFELGGSELQEKFIERIFHEYFTECNNIGDVNFLAGLSEQVGVMPKDKALAFLKSDEYQEEIQQMAAEARKKGVTGVPFTIINGRWAVSGGQSAETYAQIFRKLAGKGRLQPIPTAPSCNNERSGSHACATKS